MTCAILIVASLVTVAYCSFIFWATCYIICNKLYEYRLNIMYGLFWYYTQYCLLILAWLFHKMIPRYPELFYGYPGVIVLVTIIKRISMFFTYHVILSIKEDIRCLSQVLFMIWKEIMITHMYLINQMSSNVVPAGTYLVKSTRGGSHSTATGAAYDRGCIG